MTVFLFLHVRKRGREGKSEQGVPARLGQETILVLARVYNKAYRDGRHDKTCGRTRGQ